MSGLLKKKHYPLNYPKDVLNIINTMSYSKGKEVNIVGSMSLSSQLYAGDYDLNEFVDGGTVKQYVRGLQTIIKFLMNTPDCYIGDIKAGESRGEPIRWTPKDILAGEKDGVTLEDAIQMPALVKLDVVAFVQQSRFVDFSILYFYKVKGKVLNDVAIDPEADLKKDIATLSAEGNYFKVAKRMFALAKLKGDKKILPKLNDLFNGDCGRLYSIISDCKTILYLLENEENIDIAKVRYEIDQFRQRLGNIYTLKVNTPGVLHKILEMQTLPNTPAGRKHLEDAMTRLVDFFSPILSKAAKAALDQI
jgi:hypothetical protein